MACLLLLAPVLLPASPSADAATTWGQRADTLITRAMAADLDDGSVIGDSMLTVALLHRRGPDDVATSAYLQRLLSRQHTDGGFGLDVPWDTWGDGTTNPASTAYTVSMAGHAWPALRDALEAGVDYADVEDAAQRLLVKLWTIPYIPVRPGVCLVILRPPKRPRRVLRPQRQRRWLHLHLSKRGTWASDPATRVGLPPE